MSRRSRPLRGRVSPEAQALISAMQSTRPTRRAMLGGMGALGLTGALSACGTSSEGPDPLAASGGGPSPAADRSETEKTIRWANWTLYLDYDDETKKYPTLERFQQESGLTATYAEEIDDNESYYGKVQAQLRQGQDIGADLITLTDFMAARLVNLGWVQKLDQAKIPNGSNILPNLKGEQNLAWDPNRDHSYTWQSGYAGLGWNVEQLKKLTGKSEIKTLDELWDPKLRGRVEVLSEMRDTVGLILRAQGVDITKDLDAAKWQAGLDVLQEQLSNKQIRQVKGNSYKEDLTSGDAVAVIGWSGDLFQLNAEQGAGKYGFAIPESGGTLWSDNLLVPVGSAHKSNAERLIDFYYDPAVAAEVAAYVNYICPVQGAKEAMAKLPDVDRTVLESPYIFPTAEDLAKVQVFQALGDTQEREFTTAFQKVLGA